MFELLAVSDTEYNLFEPPPSSSHVFELCLCGPLCSAFGCPYSDINMRKEVVLPDRLGGERVITLVPVTVYHHGSRSNR